MYLELMSRIPVVAARTHVGSARLQEAQDAVGLSNESVARLIPVSEKTWRRWKDAGEIPTASLPAVARALRLELKQVPAPDWEQEQDVVSLELLAAGQEAMLSLLRENAARLARIEQVVSRGEDV